MKSFPGLLAVYLAAALAAGAASAQAPGVTPDSERQVNADTLRPGPRLSPLLISRAASTANEYTAASPLGQDRPRAVEYTDWYYRRQTVHRYASFLTLPFFVAQYLAGEELLKNGDHAASWARSAHPALASGIAALFVLNTVAGAWNWWDSRVEPEGRVLRTLHAATMLAADIGFLTIGEAESEEGGGRSDSGLQSHRRHAIVSMSIATAGYLLMLIPSLGK